MDNLIDDLVRAARRCESAGRAFDMEPVQSIQTRLLENCQKVGLAWCGSWLGYFANIYLEGLRPARPGEHFDVEWGSIGGYGNRSVGRWCEYSFEAVKAEIMQCAGVNDLGPLNDAAGQAEDAFDTARGDIIPALDAILSTREDKTLRGLRKTIAEMASRISMEQFADVLRPKGQFITRDTMAAGGGQRVPPHVQFQIWIMERCSCGQQAKELAKTTRQAVKYMQYKMNMKGGSVAKTDGTIFIGHGGAPAWRDVKDFIQDRLRSWGAPLHEPPARPHRGSLGNRWDWGRPWHSSSPWARTGFLTASELITDHGEPWNAEVICEMEHLAHGYLSRLEWRGSRWGGRSRLKKTAAGNILIDASSAAIAGRCR